MVKKRPCPLAIPPVRCVLGSRSDPARQVHLGIKTGAFYGQEAIPPEATQPVRCMFWVKTGAFWDQEATMPAGAFYGQEGRMKEWSREILRTGFVTAWDNDGF